MNTKELERILYVEDEPDIQTIARIGLEAVGGFTLKICSSGAEAIAAVTDFNPDLILLDVMMPDMDGPTTLAELRKLPATASTPVMFMTAKAQPQEIEYFKSLGALDTVAKPFDPISLSSHILEVWKKC